MASCGICRSFRRTVPLMQPADSCRSNAVLISAITGKAHPKRETKLLTNGKQLKMKAAGDRMHIDFTMTERKEIWQKNKNIA